MMKENRDRAILFSDWDLETIISNMDPNQEEQVSLGLDLIQQGQFEDADNWLRAEISRYPWTLISAAYIQIQLGKVEEAKRYLRAITLISQEALVQLWAWHNLRRLGKNPTSPLAEHVLGIIIEVPYEESTDILASYVDGTARYINHQGAEIVWDDEDQEITPLVLEGFRIARPMGELNQLHSDNPIPEGEVRLSIMTPSGIYIWEGSPEDGSDVSRLFVQQAALLKALVNKALGKRTDGDN